MYLEDVDLAWRLRLRGWRSVYAPDGRVLHVGSGTSGEGSPFKNRLLARNKVWTVVKNYPSWPLVVVWPLLVAYDLASAPYRVLVEGQTAALAGRVDALRGLGGAVRQRRAIQARRKVGWATLRSTVEPWTAPWRIPGRYRHLVAADTPPTPMTPSAS
jgi:GT2 family glycosyltransferase